MCVCVVGQVVGIMLVRISNDVIDSYPVIRVNDVELICCFLILARVWKMVLISSNGNSSKKSFAHKFSLVANPGAVRIDAVRPIYRLYGVIVSAENILFYYGALSMRDGRLMVESDILILWVGMGFFSFQFQF